MAEKVRFVSTNARLRMVRRTTGEQIMPNGSVAITTPEVVYEFEDGGLTLLVGQDIMEDGWNPETGRFELPQDAVSWIRSTPEFGDRIIEVTPVAPPAADVLSKVYAAAVAEDVDALIALGDEEAGSWNRDEVLDVIRGAVERLTVEPAKAS